MFYLYVKTHQDTGLKYLGQTSKDPHTYLGSGLYWLKHLRKHGTNISTEVLLETTNKTELKEKGIYYSQLWNIVESKEWANLTEEKGDGGNIVGGRKHSPESIQKMKDIHKGKVFSEEHKRNLSIAHKNTRTGKDNHFFGKQHSEEAKKKMSDKLTGKIRTDEFKQNLSKLYKGKPKGPMSEETKRRISETKRRNKMK